MLGADARTRQVRIEVRPVQREPAVERKPAAKTERHHLEHLREVAFQAVGALALRPLDGSRHRRRAARNPCDGAEHGKLRGEHRADERARQEALEADPKYQEKRRREAEKLKARGKKEMEKQRKRSDRKAAKAAKTKEKLVAKAAKEQKKEGLAAVKRSSRKRDEAAAGRKPSSSERGSDTRPARKKNSVIALVAILAITVGAVFLLYPPQDKITMGLDIQGGVSVNLSASTTDGSQITKDQMEQAQKVITNRVNSSGASAASVQQQGSNSFLVQVPGASADSQKILDTLSSQGVLEFVNVNDIKSSKVRGYIQQGLTGMNLKTEKVKYTAFMTGDNVTQTTVGREQGNADYAVNLQLDSAGTQAFAEVSKELVSTNGQIAILLDGVVKSAPAVQSAITNGQVQITGNYTSEEANQLKTIIDSGSLPVSLKIESASTVGPTLGQNALWSGILAALIGLALVIIWMLVFYNGLGLLPACSIIIMSVVYLGLLAGLSQLGWFSLTLPGIAGIIVNIGMAADSSILIMECFHEQIREGKSVKTASRTGVHEGIFTSIDADVVTLVSALVLYFFAMGDVRGFGLTLALGIMCDLLIMFLFSGPIMRIMGPNVIRRHPGFWGIGDDVNEGAFHAKEVR